MNILKHLILALAVLAPLAWQSPAQAVSGSEFQAGRIIDDQVFFDPNAMSVAQIQAFLVSKVPTCDTSGTQIFTGYYDGRDAQGVNHSPLPSPRTYTASDNIRRSQLDNRHPAPFTCLKDYVENPSTKEHNYGRPSHTVPSGLSAAQIIYNEAQAYSISPKVLLVLLQKESSIVTDDWPWYNQYRTATGFACPDTAACDTTYYGFYNQVHYAARQYRLYANNPSGYGYKIGANTIKYHPNSACGTKQVTIANQATAGLYIYTPYTPNQAALNNLYGTGDACSAYGNRNFWRLFNDWFGSTLSYDYKFVSAINPPSVMQPGQTVTATVVLKNTGGQVWWDETNAQTYKDPAGEGAPTPMRLYTTQPNDHDNPFGGGTGWVGKLRMTMLSGKTGPGDNGTFQFSYTAPTTPGTYIEHFAPTIENVRKMTDVGMAFKVTVPKVYTYQFVSATNPPAVMQPGQSATATVVLKNTGNTTWGNETGQPSTPMRLYTTQPMDHNNPFGGGAGWVGKLRMTMDEATVAPGQNATFTSTWTAPTIPGVYRERFAPTIENVIKMKDIGMEFGVTVPRPHAYKFISAVNPPSTMSKGQTVTATVVLQNVGSVAWGNETNSPSTPMRLYTTQPQDHNNPFGGGTGWVGKLRMTMQNATAGYGENATFSFDYTAPQAAGSYCEHFAPTIENVIKLTDIGMAFCVNVQ